MRSIRIYHVHVNLQHCLTLSDTTFEASNTNCTRSVSDDEVTNAGTSITWEGLQFIQIGRSDQVWFITKLAGKREGGFFSIRKR